MILKGMNESTLQAIARTGREQSCAAVRQPTESSIAHLYELVGALAQEVVELRAELDSEFGAGLSGGTDE